MTFKKASHSFSSNKATTQLHEKAFNEHAEVCHSPDVRVVVLAIDGDDNVGGSLVPIVATFNVSAALLKRNNFC